MRTNVANQPAQLFALAGCKRLQVSPAWLPGPYADVYMHKVGFRVISDTAHSRQWQRGADHPGEPFNAEINRLSLHMQTALGHAMNELPIGRWSPANVARDIWIGRVVSIVLRQSVQQVKQVW